MRPHVSHRHVLDFLASLRRSASEKSNEPMARLALVGMKAMRASRAVLTLQEGCLVGEDIG